MGFFRNMQSVFGSIFQPFLFLEDSRQHNLNWLNSTKNGLTCTFETFTSFIFDRRNFSDLLSVEIIESIPKTFLPCRD